MRMDYSEMNEEERNEKLTSAISYCKGDTKENETPIEEPETGAKVLNILSPCFMDIDSQTNNQLPQVITSEEIPAATCDDKPDRLEIAWLYNEKLDVNEPTHEQTEPSSTGHWEENELVSKDGQAKLKANVFFACFDQSSNKAVGESASLMRGNGEKEGVSSDQASDDEICSGKECCREFMKRFLAAIPLRELELEKKKERFLTSLSTSDYR
ncbi:hypothetical protein LOK49_LG12G02057 [Camellia lanceoleosa]|uniref:Uncharacterized protein n=1 Tax=Camellia lanceoleosa TaxID=1840588 RepID=A0ACC0FRR2_9ERIC|nr:hypothetical protein LOK49_LG12G02057 [Camellia lanceoleosa]